jgi:hypothetical protein
LADQVTTEHQEQHGPHPAARRCGTHRYNRTRPATRTEKGSEEVRLVDRLYGQTVYRLVIVPGGRDYGQKPTQHRLETRRRRAKNRVARRARTRNRRRAAA